VNSSSWSLAGDDLHNFIDVVCPLLTACDDDDAYWTSLCIIINDCLDEVGVQVIAQKCAGLVDVVVERAGARRRSPDTEKPVRVRGVCPSPASAR
jgi:hypothetical protein